MNHTAELPLVPDTSTTAGLREAYAVTSLQRQHISYHAALATPAIAICLRNLATARARRAGQRRS